MAYWGEAMTDNHPIWMQQDRDAALRALARLAATPAARAAKAPTQPEKDYLQAVEVLYGEGNKEERDRACAEEMRRLFEKYPADDEAATFGALALLGTCHEGRDFRVYMQAAGILEQVYQRNPEHPGAVHYLIHCYDDPVHAPLGLRPARAYARIPTAASHAQHMPSHIFLALGMWGGDRRVQRGGVGGLGRAGAAQGTRAGRAQLPRTLLARVRRPAAGADRGRPPARRGDGERCEAERFGPRQDTPGADACGPDRGDGDRPAE